MCMHMCMVVFSTVQWNLSLYEDTPEIGCLSKQDTFSHPKYHSCMHFNL